MRLLLGGAYFWEGAYYRSLISSLQQMRLLLGGAYYRGGGGGGGIISTYIQFYKNSENLFPLFKIVKISINPWPIILEPSYHFLCILWAYVTYFYCWMYCTFYG